MGASKYAQLDDQRWLRFAYSEQGLSLGQIADKVGCSISAVHHAMTRHQIVRRPRRGNLPTSARTLGDEIVRRYQDGETGEQIAAHLGVGRQTVYNVLAERGVERRTPAKRRTPGLEEASLRKLYVDEKISAKRIAAMLRCSTAVVERALHRHGIPIRGRSLGNDDRLSEINLRRMYEVERLPVAQIAAELGISTVTLWKYLGLRGIPARTRSQAQRAKYPEEGAIRTRYVDNNGYVMISVVLTGGRVAKMAEH